jgi:hypothetical protein
MKFILVNGRRPRLHSSCALCGEPIGETYLREIRNPALSYCDYKCYLARLKLAARKQFKSRGARSCR